METAVNNGMCRCCASEGTFKDVKTKYHWMGEEEVYSEMLKNCLDINLCTSENGDNGGICEVCITQLRNAANFRKQVLHTEEQFKMRLQDKLFKPSIVKVEMLKDDGMESDNNLSEDYSVPEFEVPVKEESPEEAKPKKRTTKASTTRGKKAKLDDGETSTKHVQRESQGIYLKIEPFEEDSTKTLDKKERNDRPKIKLKKINELMLKPSSSTKTKKAKKANSPDRVVLKKVAEIEQHQQNIRQILLYSNATPIRCRSGIGYACNFCADQYPQPEKLKQHTLDAHDNYTKSKFMKGAMMKRFLVKLDITDLRCTICETSIKDLQKLMEHLKTVHEKLMHLDIKNHIVPFRFEVGSDLLHCVVCSTEFNNFKVLLEHMNSHYRNYVCDVCDSGFVNKNIMLLHTNRHATGEFTCSHCQKVFNNKIKMKDHEKAVHMGFNRRYKCGFCGERFTHNTIKVDHLVKVHGVKPLVIQCNACDKSFASQKQLTMHMKQYHLMFKPHKCKECNMEFSMRKELVIHMVKHTGTREFQCDVCLKSYGRLNTLKEHLRIHANDRRFKCEHCGQAFVQKCSWRGHMRSKHGEEV